MFLPLFIGTIDHIFGCIDNSEMRHTLEAAKQNSGFNCRTCIKYIMPKTNGYVCNICYRYFISEEYTNIPCEVCKSYPIKENMERIKCLECISLLEKDRENSFLCMKCSRLFLQSMSSTNICVYCNKFDLEFFDDIPIQYYNSSFPNVIIHRRCFFAHFEEIVKFYNSSDNKLNAIKDCFSSLEAYDWFKDCINICIRGENKVYLSHSIFKETGNDVNQLRECFLNRLENLDKHMNNIREIKCFFEFNFNILYRMKDSFIAYTICGQDNILDEHKKRVVFIREVISHHEETYINIKNIKNIIDFMLLNCIYITNTSYLDGNCLKFILSHIRLEHLIIELNSIYFCEEINLNIIKHQLESFTVFIHSNSLTEFLKIFRQISVSINTLAFLFLDIIYTDIIIEEHYLKSLTRFNPKKLILTRPNNRFLFKILKYYINTKSKLNEIYIEHNDDDPYIYGNEQKLEFFYFRNNTDVKKVFLEVSLNTDVNNLYILLLFTLQCVCLQKITLKINDTEVFHQHYQQFFFIDYPIEVFFVDELEILLYTTNNVLNMSVEFINIISIMVTYCVNLTLNENLFSVFIYENKYRYHILKSLTINETHIYCDTVAAFLSLAPNIRSLEIDCCVLHPSSTDRLEYIRPTDINTVSIINLDLNSLLNILVTFNIEIMILESMDIFNEITVPNLPSRIFIYSIFFYDVSLEVLQSSNFFRFLEMNVIFEKLYVKDPLTDELTLAICKTS